MKTYWLYVIDWRTRAVDIIGEMESLEQRTRIVNDHLDSLDKESRADFSKYKCFGLTPVTDEMMIASQPFRVGA